MNGKPYHGARLVSAPYTVPRSFVDYAGMAEIVKDGIKRGLITPPLTLCDIESVKKELTAPRRNYGTGQCALCAKEYSKLSRVSVVCTPCKSAESKCPICSKMFVPYRKGRKNVSSCSTACGVELMKKTVKAKSKK